MWLTVETLLFGRWVALGFDLVWLLLFAGVCQLILGVVVFVCAVDALLIVLLFCLSGF